MQVPKPLLRRINASEHVHAFIVNYRRMAVSRSWRRVALKKNPLLLLYVVKPHVVQRVRTIPPTEQVHDIVIYDGSMTESSGRLR